MRIEIGGVGGAIVVVGFVGRRFQWWQEVVADDKLLQTYLALANGLTEIGELFGVVETSVADVGGQAIRW